MLGLAAASLLVWAVFEWLAVRGPADLAAALAGAFGRAGSASAGPAPAMDASHLAVGAYVVLVAATVTAYLIVGRRPRPRSLGVSPSLGEIPPATSLVIGVLALLSLLASMRVGLATAARAADAPGLDALWCVWSSWLRRALLALAIICAGLGVVERLLAARRLWQGLHLTRAQAREQARASGRR